MKATKVGRHQPANDIYLAAKSAYERAQADFSARKRAVWATRILQAVWSSADRYDAAVLQEQTDLLIAAMRKFEDSTDGPCGGATALIAAAVANYYGAGYVLDTLWELQVRDMAKVEHALDVELGMAEVDALHGAMIHAMHDADAEAQIPEEEAV